MNPNTRLVVDKLLESVYDRQGLSVLDNNLKRQSRYQFSKGNWADSLKSGRGSAKIRSKAEFKDTLSNILAVDSENGMEYIVPMDSKYSYVLDKIEDLGLSKNGRLDSTSSSHVVVSPDSESYYFTNLSDEEINSFVGNASAPSVEDNTEDSPEDINVDVEDEEMSVESDDVEVDEVELEREQYRQHALDLVRELENTPEE